MTQMIPKIRKISQEDVDKLSELEENIAKANKELKEFKIDLLRKYDCKKTLGILNYKTRKHKGTFGERIEEKEYTILVYENSWYVGADEIYPRFCHIKGNGCDGNSVDLCDKRDVEFVPMEDTTLEEARRILKEVKKK